MDDVVLSPEVWEVGDCLQIDVGREYIEMASPVTGIRILNEEESVEVVEGYEAYKKHMGVS